MSSQTNVSRKGLVIGSLLGGIVGAVTALFVAPKSGKELRQDIQNQAIDVKDKTVDVADTAKEKVNEMSTLVKDKSANVSKTILEQGEQLTNKAQGVISDFQRGDKVDINDLKQVTKELMTEEIKSGKEIGKIVKSEMKGVQNKVNKDLREIRKEIKETVKN
jgi:gas vesicle protein